MRYRRSDATGATFFFTVNLADRTSRLLVEQIGELRTSFRRVRQAHPFEIVAMVVLPDHIHAVWTMPAGDRDYPMRWSLIKAGFSRALVRTESIRHSRQQKRERGIWQRRYWEHQIRNDDDLAKHVDYIHFNPVKHGHVSAPIDWPHSSIHQHIRRGLLLQDWGIASGKDDMLYGESR
jgi:putative transposase